MILNKNKALFYLQFPGLLSAGGISHGIFTRCGGFGNGVVKDPGTPSQRILRQETTEKDKRRVLGTLGFEDLVFVDQVHGSRILTLDAADPNQPDPAFKPVEADAVITNQKGRLIAIETADCQAVMLFDPLKKVVANIHSGWRGSLQNIVGKTVHAMKDRFGGRPGQILAGIGPSLGPCCGEFINYKQEIPKKHWKHRTNNNHFNFWALTMDQLLEAGIDQKNICFADICTMCNTGLFYSYRKEKHTGRLVSAIGINSGVGEF